jgi:D-glycero-alpha-D-manno-heptose 1-phosphate guanylyltransferase
MKDIKAITAIVLCGGVGSRLRSVVSDVPKPLARINGQPFLDILLKWLAGSECVSHAVLAAGHLGNIIKSRYNCADDLGIDTTTLIETKKLGTGGAIRNSLLEITADHVIVLNGDSFIYEDLDKVYAEHILSNCDVTFTVKYLSDTSRFGRLNLCEKTKKVLGFMEKSQYDEGGYINCGLYIFKTSWARENFLDESFSLEEWFQENIVEHDVGFFSTESSFIDIGTPATYLESQSFFNLM